MIEDLTAICTTLDVHRPAVVGHDLGAALGWILAAGVPGFVSRFAALAVGYPVGFAGLPLEQLQRFWYLLLFASPVAEDFLADDDWRGLRIMAADHPRLDEVIERFDDRAAMTAALQWYRANMNPQLFVTYHTDAPHLACPVLALRGADDAVNGPEQMARSERFVDGAWASVTVPGAGHWLQVDSADVVNDHLLRFLA